MFLSIQFCKLQHLNLKEKLKPQVFDEKNLIGIIQTEFIIQYFCFDLNTMKRYPCKIPIESIRYMIRMGNFNKNETMIFVGFLRTQCKEMQIPEDISTLICKFYGMISGYDCIYFLREIDRPFKIDALTMIPN